MQLTGLTADLTCERQKTTTEVEKDGILSHVVDMEAAWFWRDFLGIEGSTFYRTEDFQRLFFSSHQISSIYIFTKIILITGIDQLKKMPC